MSMDASAVAAVRDLALKTATPVDIGGVIHTATPLHDSRKPGPEPTPLTVSRLSSLVDYLANVRSPDQASIVALHVEGPGKVSAVGALYGHHQQRNVYAVATCPNRMGATEFAFGKFMELESMNIALQALFEDAGDRAVTLQLVGGVKADVVRTQEDDGVTQQVAVKAGVTLVKTAQVPNPVKLAPRRTFAEVKQPLVPFILRLKDHGERGVMAALFEADGGAWQGEAVSAIAEYLRAAGHGLPVLA